MANILYVGVTCRRLSTVRVIPRWKALVVACWCHSTLVSHHRVLQILTPRFTNFDSAFYKFLTPRFTNFDSAFYKFLTPRFTNPLHSAFYKSTPLCVLQHAAEMGIKR